MNKQLEIRTRYTCIIVFDYLANTYHLHHTDCLISNFLRILLHCSYHWLKNLLFVNKLSVTNFCVTNESYLTAKNHIPLGFKKM